MVGQNSQIRVCSALVAGPSGVESIEHLVGGLFPESFPRPNVQRGGLDDTGPKLVKR